MYPAALTIITVMTLSPSMTGSPLVGSPGYLDSPRCTAVEWRVAPRTSATDLLLAGG